MSVFEQLPYEQRLRLVAEQDTRLALITTDPRGQVVDWNPGAEALFGWTAAEMAGKPISTIFLPGDVASGVPEQEMRQALANGHGADPRWMLRKDGGQVFVQGGLIPLRLPDGSLAGYAKRVQEAVRLPRLRRGEAELRVMLNATPHMVWSADADGNADYYNDRALDFTGQPLQALLGLRWLDVVHPEDRAATGDAWRAAVQAARPLAMEFRFRHQSGRYRWVQCRGEPVMTEDQQRVERWIGTNTDIHDQKVANTTLRDARQRLEATLSVGNIGTWNYNLVENLVHADRNMARLHGIALEPDQGLDPEFFFAAIHRDDVDEVRNCIERAISSGDQFSASYRVALPDGSMRHLNVRGKAVYSADGTPLWFPGVAIDVTALKASQEELRMREERYRTLFNAMDEGFVIIEMVYDEAGRLVDHRYLEANAAVSAITGQADIVGRLASEAFPGYTLDWHEMYRQVLDTRAPLRFTAEVHRWQRWIDFSIHPIEGTPAQVAVFLRDITPLKRREEALRRSEERYRALFNSIEEGIAVIEMLFDAQGKAVDYRFIEVNPALERLTGLHNVVGRTLREVVPHPQLDWVERYGIVARTGEPEHMSDFSSALDAWYDISVVRVEPAGNNQVVLLFSDVTERRQRDEALRQLAEDLARANLRQHEFLATLAHELRNPLAPIKASLDLMRMSPTPATMARAQEILTRQVDHMVHLVDDLLDLARVSSGKIELRKGPVLLSAILHAAVEAAQPLITARRHDFRQRIERAPMWLEADANRLVQVVGNLLTNAAKYTPEGGTITLTASRDGDNAVIAVEDNGIGIAPEAQDKVFDMFSQVHAGSELTHGGLGIGLNLVKRLTDKHDGTVTVSSPGPGRGATFTLVLPLRDPPAADGHDRHAATAPARNLRILVVDDNADAADTLALILRADGHTVEVAYEAQGALALAAQFRPDVGVLDIGLPGMNGHQLAQALRGTADLAGIGLIALTGWGTGHDRELSREAGFDAHLTKPVSIETLHAELARLTT